MERPIIINGEPCPMKAPEDMIGREGTQVDPKEVAKLLGNLDTESVGETKHISACEDFWEKKEGATETGLNPKKVNNRLKGIGRKCSEEEADKVLEGMKEHNFNAVVWAIEKFLEGNNTRVSVHDSNICKKPEIGVTTSRTDDHQIIVDISLPMTNNDVDMEKMNLFN